MRRASAVRPAGQCDKADAVDLVVLDADQRHRRRIVLTDQGQGQLSPLNERERLEGDVAVIAWGSSVALLV